MTVLFGILGLVGAMSPQAAGAADQAQGSGLITSIVILVAYAFSLFALLTGGRDFNRDHVG